MPRKTITLLKGKRLGQTKVSTKTRVYVIKRGKKVKRITIPAGYYVKGGKLIKYSRKRDMARISRHRRKKGEAPWRGDAYGSVI
jgi:hypothetical protein